MYKPSCEFNTHMMILKPDRSTKLGVVKKEYLPSSEMFCSFKTFGGTETTSNGVIVIENTAIIDTWFNPDITADCILKSDTGQRYEIIGTPENIENKNIFMKFKVREIKGGA